jgi:hypothetical protein
MALRKEEEVLVTCGIPFSSGTLKGCDQNIIPDNVLENGKIDLRIGEIISIGKCFYQSPRQDLS